jgi:uncharacterized membrane protein YfcA
MPLLPFTALVFAGSFLAGLVGAMTGLGGAVVLIPLLTLGFHVDLRYAIGASLISVIATSSGAAAAYVRDGLSNVRIGMFLEVATTIGAVFGAFLATRVPTRALAIVFGLVLIYSAWLSRSQKAHPPENAAPNPWSERLGMSGSYPVKGCGTADGRVRYSVDRIPWGFATMFGAGTLSGLLGIGSGAVKVLAMDKIMRIPFKVSTTTSNFMIGVTAAASAGVYFSRGDINPFVAAPVAAGVLLGATAGSLMLGRLKSSIIRGTFIVVLVWISLQMLWKGIHS